MKVTVRASCRADLAGGTLDIWPLGVLHAGARTVNVALELSVRVVMSSSDAGYQTRQFGRTVSVDNASELLADRDTALIGLVLEALEVPPVEIQIESESPKGAGLGASSALTVALIAAAEAITGRPALSREEKAWLARDLEARLMGLPTGCQDHYPALYGGGLDLQFLPGRTEIRSIDLDLDEFSDCLVLAYSGASHVSAENNWSVVRSRLNGDERLKTLFDGIAEVASRMAAALEAGDFERAGAALTEEWQLRRQLSEVVSIPILEELLDAAKLAGAWGGKACGAGGGGCIALLAPPASRAAVEKSLQELGEKVLPSRCADRGLDLTD